MPSYSASQPYASERSAVAADNLVATSQPLAVEAGLGAMRRGGNAIDAALAAAITLTVVEPNNNGLGSDAFAQVWDGDTLHGLNASGRSPAAWTADRFAGRASVPIRGWDSVTVPGAVSAWVALSKRFGQLRFAELFTDAIRYAEDGFHVGPKSAFYWQLTERGHRRQDAFAKHFFPAPKAGERFHRPDMAATLRRIADSDGEDFYRGELAERIIAASDAEGGVMTLADLDTHRCDWVETISQRYRDVALNEIPPNGQGLAALIALGILRHLDAPPADTADGVHLQLEAMKIAVRAAAEHIADSDALQTPVEALLEPKALARLASRIGKTAADLPPAALPVGHDTVYLCTADREGRMVSFIQSNFMGFGAGIVIPGTGISMQNRGAGFTLADGHPNQVGPRKRPFHTIIPGFVTDSAGARLAFGVMGGHMQHQGHVQMVSRLFDHGQNPQAAIDAPRWHVYPNFDVGLEPGFNHAVAGDLATRGHRVRFEHQEHVFGGAQLILNSGDGYIAGSDPRKEGFAAGF